MHRHDPQAGQAGLGDLEVGRVLAAQADAELAGRIPHLKGLLAGDGGEAEAPGGLVETFAAHGALGYPYAEPADASGAR
ncbi:hypothetical protein GCM10009679_07490 [Saccharothrix algeriensis]|uniref:Uncharacterized protein n=1 Tax=Catellatospora bangladeshensis TaxID=310355 RepID=A0A8J3JMQ2_9ACTN|nr:hypothetical protein Cba03nite_12930 [Catellatospora bangladeshensis]